MGMDTVVDTFRSAPRPAGAAMLVGPGGEAVASSCDARRAGGRGGPVAA